MMIFQMNVAPKVCMRFYLVTYAVAYDSVYHSCVVLRRHLTGL